MTPKELAYVQAQVAVAIQVLKDLDLEAAFDLMERTREAAKAADPVLWARSKDAHIRMTALVGAALTFQKTFQHIQEAVAEARPAATSAARSGLILPS